MKKIPIVLGGILIALALALGIQILYTVLTRKPGGVADKIGNGNINVMLARPGNWKKIVDDGPIDFIEMDIIDGSTATIPITAELLRQFFGYTDAQVNKSVFVNHSTTHNAYINLIDRRYISETDGHPVSLIFVTPPSDEETRYASEKGVELDLTPIAKDGFVFITHKDNPVDSLTVAQIQSIYAGGITNWKQLGGNDLEIKAYQREKNSGSQTAMEQTVMQGKRMKPPVQANIYEGMGELVEAVAEYENGPASIGYTYCYYINNLYKNDKIKVIKVDGISPSDENLVSGVYPFTTSYYAVIRGDEPEGSPAKRLRDFLVTPKGQDLIAMAGYCKAEIRI